MRIAVIPWYRTWLNIHAIASRYSIESEEKWSLNREEGEGEGERNKERKKLLKKKEKAEKQLKRAKRDKKTR